LAPADEPEDESDDPDEDDEAADSLFAPLAAASDFVPFRESVR
jgi:hypothetical protein